MKKTKLNWKQKNLIILGALALVGIVGFLLVLSSIGTLDNDFITVSAQLSLNVRTCVVGVALMFLATGLFKMLFQKKGKYDNG